MLCESVAKLVGVSAVAHGNYGVAPAPQVKQAPEGLPSADRGVNEGAAGFSFRQKPIFRNGCEDNMTLPLLLPCRVFLLWLRRVIWLVSA